MTKYKAAVIGLGRMGSTFDDEMAEGGSLFRPYCHGPTYYYHPDIELVAGADPHDEQRSIFGERWSVPNDRLYTSHIKMLEREDLDIVSVTTSARIRPDIVKDVARAGVKIIWAEKPISLSLEDADEMVRVCRDEGVTFAVNCARRWMDGYSEARQLIDTGQIGKVLQVTAHFPTALSGNGSHLIDTVRYLAGGEVEWVFGEIESDEAAATDEDVNFNGYLAFDNGVRAFMRAWECGDTNSSNFTVIGEHGQIYCQEHPAQFDLIRHGAPMPYGEGYRGPSTRMESPMPVRYPIPLPPQVKGTGFNIIEDLIQAHENGTDAKVSGEDGLKALEIAIALRESHRRGGVKVNLPLEDRSLKVIAGESVNDDLPKRVRREMGLMPQRLPSRA